MKCRSHQLADALPIITVQAFHVVRKGMRVQRDLRMRMGAEKRSSLDADGSIAKSGAFGGAGNYSYVT